MGVGYGLAKALEADIGGVQQGQTNAKELERRARQDLLQERLLNSQMSNTQSEIQRRADQSRIEEEKARNRKAPPRLVDPVTQQVWERNDETGEWEPARMATPKPTTPVPSGTPPPTGQQPTPSPRQLRIHPKPARPISLAPGGTLIDPVTLQPVAHGAPKPLSVVERETNAAGHTALDLIKHMRGLRQQSTTANRLPLGAAVARAPGSLPVIGGALQKVAEPIAQQFMTSQQAAYQQDADQLLHLASSILPKGGRSIALLQNLRASFTSPALAKNPQAAIHALDELERQIQEVVGQVPDTGGFHFKYKKSP